MGHYRKKPVVIEARKLTRDNVEEIEAWINSGRPTRMDDAGLLIETLEGDHRASWGNYVIKGVRGEFYSCDPDIFDETYEEVSDPKARAEADRINMIGTVVQPIR